MAMGTNLSVAVLLLLGADPWVEALEFRAAYQFAEELRACTVAIEQNNRRTAVCKRRVTALENRRDSDGAFACLRELSIVRAEYRDLDRAESWNRVSALLERERCSNVLKADALIWLRREALKRSPVPEEVALAESFSQEALEPKQVLELADLEMEFLARTGDFDAAYQLEQEMNLARSRRASESLYFEQHQAIVRRLSWWSRAILMGFALVAIPAAVAVIRQRGFGTWRGLRYSIPLVAVFGILACFKEPSQVALWLTLGVGAAGLQWLTAYAAHFRQSWTSVVSLAGAMATLAAFWEILVWYGETAWVY